MVVRDECAANSAAVRAVGVPGFTPPVLEIQSASVCSASVKAWAPSGQADRPVSAEVAPRESSGQGE